MLFVISLFFTTMYLVRYFIAGDMDYLVISHIWLAVATVLGHLITSDS